MQTKCILFNSIISINILAIIFIMNFGTIITAEPTGNNSQSKKINLTITIIDSVNNHPLELVNIFLQQDDKIIKADITDPRGTVVFRNIEPGQYRIISHCIGYRDNMISAMVDKKSEQLTIAMIPTSLQMPEVVIKSSKQIHISNSIDLKTGGQIITTEADHTSPVNRFITVIQENVLGAVKQPVGEMVIRDQHNEYSTSSYYIDGVPIPPGTLGDLNEIVNPEIIQRITTYTGGFPAEYGGQSAAVFNIQSKIPTNGFHLNLSSYIGSYITSNSVNEDLNSGSFKDFNSNGQSLSVSNSSSKIKYYFSGSRQETDRRLDQPVVSLFHDHGFDYSLFGKLDYVLSNNDFLTSNLNYSNSITQIPYDPAEGINSDTQDSYNAIQTISIYHLFNSKSDYQSKLLVSLFTSERGLKYTTDYKNDETRQYLENDTATSYTVDQDRRYFTFGSRIKFTNRLSDQFEFESGLRIELTKANEIFNFKDLSGNGPRVNSDFSSSNFGIFVQTSINPIDALLVEAGARYDQYISPSITIQKQVSPRLKLSWFINNTNTLYISYDRLLVPTNVEGLNYLTHLFGGSASDQATYPERDNLYELGVIHNFGSGLVLKSDYFHKEASPGLDDESLGASSIKINVNLGHIKISGLELSLNYNDLTNPFSFFINAALIHGYGAGLISGGFLPSEFSPNPFDLDHDQRLTLVSGINYQQSNLFMNLVINYCSGLTNGNDDYNFKTGLFDFNQGAHTTPAWITNLSVGYSFDMGSGKTLEPSIYISNLFDHHHLIKGTFFSGASFEAPREVVFKLTYHL